MMKGDEPVMLKEQTADEQMTSVAEAEATVPSTGDFVPKGDINMVEVALVAGQAGPTTGDLVPDMRSRRTSRGLLRRCRVAAPWAPWRRSFNFWRACRQISPVLANVLPTYLSSSPRRFSGHPRPRSKLGASAWRMFCGPRKSPGAPTPGKEGRLSRHRRLGVRRTAS